MKWIAAKIQSIKCIFYVRILFSWVLRDVRNFIAVLNEFVKYVACSQNYSSFFQSVTIPFYWRFLLCNKPKSILLRVQHRYYRFICFSFVDIICMLALNIRIVCVLIAANLIDEIDVSSNRWIDRSSLFVSVRMWTHIGNKSFHIKRHTNSNVSFI